MLNYELDSEAQFQLPDGAIHLDVGPSGRLYAAGVDALWRESQPGSRNFLPVNVPPFGNPAMIRISPSGRLLAVGSYENSVVRILDIPSAGQTVDFQVRVSPYDAEWFDERRLAVTGQGADGFSPPSTVHLVDVDEATVSPLVQNIPGHSAGVTFDVDGNLYTGIGLAADGGPSTGLIRAFRRADWQNAQAAGPLEFSAGKACVDLLSAAFLCFDGDNNLCVAGGGGMNQAGDPDMGYVGVVSHHGLRAALYDQPVIQDDAIAHAGDDALILQRLDPTPDNDEFYWMSQSNPVQRELYVFEYASRDIHVYRPRLVRQLIETHFQLGDNPGYYAGTRFVGMKLQMPLWLPNPADVAGGVVIRLGTQYVETLGVSRHQVLLNGTQIGEMTGGYFVEERETFDFFVDGETLGTLVDAGDSVELCVSVDTEPGPGMADDFVLRYAGVVYRPV